MQQLQDQNEYNELKNDYIQLNEQLGQREGELADIRGETTKQLGQNKDMQLKTDQIESENNRLRSHIRDCQNQQERTRNMADNLERDTGDRQN